MLTGGNVTSGVCVVTCLHLSCAYFSMVEGVARGFDPRIAAYLVAEGGGVRRGGAAQPVPGRAGYLSPGNEEWVLVRPWGKSYGNNCCSEPKYI